MRYVSKILKSYPEKNFVLKYVKYSKVNLKHNTIIFCLKRWFIHYKWIYHCSIYKWETSLNKQHLKWSPYNVYSKKSIVFQGFHHSLKILRSQGHISFPMFWFEIVLRSYVANKIKKNALPQKIKVTFDLYELYRRYSINFVIAGANQIYAENSKTFGKKDHTNS